MRLARHLLAVLLLPTVVVVVVPALLWLNAGFQSAMRARPLELLVSGLGLAMMAGGLILVTWTVMLFDREGKGTLAPWDPPRKLVIRGPYRHVRNPMISGVSSILLGEAAAARSLLLLSWFALFFVLNAAVIPLLEEPLLRRRFGADYVRYLKRVPRWLPRLRPRDI